jgi:hypothetical protein
VVPRPSSGQKIANGRYTTEAEVAADALRLLEGRDNSAWIKRARHQDMIDHGYEDVDAGKVIRLENGDQIEASSLTCEATRSHRARPGGSQVDSALFPKGLGLRPHGAVHGGTARRHEGAHRRDDRDDLRPGLHMAISARHCVFFEVDESRILVLRVLVDGELQIPEHFARVTRFR